MMKMSDINNPGERKKLIWALVLGLVAIVFLWWTFFGFGSSKPRANRNTQSTAQNPTTRAAVNPEPIQKPDEPQTTGLLTTPPQDVYALTLAASRARFQTAIHAIGDRAIRVVVG